MGKYKHEGKGRNISVGGGQERKDLFKDMSGGYNAMGDSNSPNYKYNGSAFKQRYGKSPAHKELVGDQNQLPDHLVKAIKAAPEMKGSHSPMYKSGCTSGGSSKSPYKLMGDPKKKLKGKINKLSDKHKKLYDSVIEGHGGGSGNYDKDYDKLGRIEDKLERKEKKYSKKYGSSPYSMYKHKK